MLSSTEMSLYWSVMPALWVWMAKGEAYLIAKGDLYNCIRWFKRALCAPRYESYAFPHFNLGRVYEQRRHLLAATRHYGLALAQAPSFAQAAKALRRVQSRLN